jgi:hypothetical protein
MCFHSAHNESCVRDFHISQNTECSIPGLLCHYSCNYLNDSGQIQTLSLSSRAFKIFPARSDHSDHILPSRMFCFQNERNASRQREGRFRPGSEVLEGPSQQKSDADHSSNWPSTPHHTRGFDLWRPPKTKGHLHPPGTFYCTCFIRC